MCSSHHKCMMAGRLCAVSHHPSTPHSCSCRCMVQAQSAEHQTAQERYERAPFSFFPRLRCMYPCYSSAIHRAATAVTSPQLPDYRSTSSQRLNYPLIYILYLVFSPSPAKTRTTSSVRYSVVSPSGGRRWSNLDVFRCCARCSPRFSLVKARLSS